MTNSDIAEGAAITGEINCKLGPNGAIIRNVNLCEVSYVIACGGDIYGIMFWVTSSIVINSPELQCSVQSNLRSDEPVVNAMVISVIAT